MVLIVAALWRPLERMVFEARVPEPKAHILPLTNTCVVPANTAYGKWRD